MQLHSKSFDVISPISPPSKIAEVKLNLIPALVQSHGHGADERLHPCSALVVRSPKTPPNILIVQDLHFEGKIFFQVLDNHDQEGQLNSQGLVRVRWTCDESRRHIRTHYLED